MKIPAASWTIVMSCGVVSLDLHTVHQPVLSAIILWLAAGSLGLLAAQHQVLSTGTLVLWCLAVAWLPVLIACEAVRPRLSYDVRRWATVFPLGMYAACSFTDGQVTGVPGLTTFGQVGTWVAFAAVLVALAGRFRHAHRAGRPRAAARSSRENGYLPAERTP